MPSGPCRRRRTKQLRTAWKRQVDEARQDPAGALVQLGYVFLILAVLVGALAYRVDLIVAGHGLVLLMLATAAVMRLRGGAPPIRVPIEVWILQILLVAVAIGYFAFHFPNGRYTLVSLLNVALLIHLLPGVRLPRISALALVIFLIVICGRLLAGVHGIDHVALHSKNYAFLFPLFFLEAHFCEARDHGEPPSMILLGLVALLGFATVGLANGVIAACLLIAGFVMARGWWRIGIAATVVVVLLLAWQGGAVRDAILAFHLLGAGTSDFVPIEDRHLVVKHYIERLGETLSVAQSEERFAIWGAYLESASRPMAFLLGSFSDGIDVSTSLHSSYLTTHQKFGILGLAIVAICGLLFFRLGLSRMALGWLLVICCARAGTDSIMFVGGYFDFVLIGATVAIGIKFLNRPERGAAAIPLAADQTESSAEYAASRPR